MAAPMTSLRSIAAIAGNSLLSAASWWLGELRAMLPAALRRRIDMAGLTLKVAMADGILTLQVLERGRGRQIYRGAVDPNAVQQAVSGWRRQLETGGMTVELTLDPGDVLVRTFELPVAASRRLKDALDFELGRHTPFVAGDVHMDWKTGEPKNDRLPVTLAVVTRDHVAALTGRLQPLGLFPAYACSGEARFGIAAGSGLRWSRLVSAALTVAAVAMALLLAQIEVDRQENLLERINAELVRERRNAVEVERWKSELAQAERRQKFFAGKLEDKHASIALHRLSRDLPDNVWIQQMTLQNGEIRLYGYAPEPATVINLLEAGGLFENARFRSPSTRRSGAAVDRFDISAQFRKGGGS